MLDCRVFVAVTVVIVGLGEEGGVAEQGPSRRRNMKTGKEIVRVNVDWNPCQLTDNSAVSTAQTATGSGVQTSCSSW